MISLNKKRQQIRNQIRKREKQAYFMQQRNRLFHDLEIQNPLLFITNKKNVSQAFQQIINRLKSHDYLMNFQKMLDGGLISLLMKNLQESSNIEETFEVIAISLNRNIKKSYNLFFEAGLLEYLLRFLNHTKVASFCAFILAKYAEQNEDYRDILLENNVHKILIDQFISRLRKSNDPQEQNEKEGKKFYLYIIDILDEFAQHRVNLDQTRQRKQILMFLLHILQKRIFLKASLSALYEFSNQLSSQTKNEITPLLNDLLEDALSRVEESYSYQLAAFIFSITPAPIDYQKLFKLGKIHDRLQKIIMLTIQKLMDENIYLDSIPKQEFYWSKVIQNSNKIDSFNMLLKVITNFKIKRQWTWRVFAVSLDSYNPLAVQEFGLRSLLKRMNLRQQNDNIIHFLKKHGITNKLNGLCKSKNRKISEISDQILSMISNGMYD